MALKIIFSRPYNHHHDHHGLPIDMSLMLKNIFLSYPIGPTHRWAQRAPVTFFKGWPYK